MLKQLLLHPEILSVLGQLGHGSRVLIADGNYPFLTASHPAAHRVYMNLTPGIVSATDILRVLVEVIPIQEAAVMQPESELEPGIFAEFAGLLPPEMELIHLSRKEFYSAACDSDTALVIASGEQRVYGNVLITIGVVLPNTPT